tara:strand:- start:3903 stop:4223 length:321 start_codon:yes stop_codon:yes gene_type:complete
MLSLYKYRHAEGDITAVLKKDLTVQLLHNGVVVDSCKGRNNYSLENISVAYSDIECKLEGEKNYLLMYLDTGRYKYKFKFKDVLSALVKMNNTPVTESANIKEFDY